MSKYRIYYYNIHDIPDPRSVDFYKDIEAETEEEATEKFFKEVKGDYEISGIEEFIKNNQIKKSLGEDISTLSQDVKDFIIGEAEYGELDVADILDSLAYLGKDYNEADVIAFIEEVNSGNVTKEVPMVLVDPQATYRYGEANANNLNIDMCLTVDELIEYLQTTFDGDAKLMIKHNGEYCPIQGANFTEAGIDKPVVK